MATEAPGTGARSFSQAAICLLESLVIVSCVRFPGRSQGIAVNSPVEEVSCVRFPSLHQASFDPRVKGKEKEEPIDDGRSCEIELLI